MQIKAIVEGNTIRLERGSFWIPEEAAARTMPLPSRVGAGGAQQGRKGSIMADMLPEGLDMEHLEKLDKMMLVVAFIGVFVNLAQLSALGNHAWVKATALSGGQPFTAL
jgi:hypothetical protein